MALTSSNVFFKWGSTTRRHFPALLDGHSYTWVKPRSIKRGLYSGDAYTTTGKRWRSVTATLLVSYASTATATDPDSQSAARGVLSEIVTLIDASPLYFADPQSNTYRAVLVTNAEIRYEYSFDPQANYSVVQLTLEDVTAT
jgi:hypothetical protein